MDFPSWRPWSTLIVCRLLLVICTCSARASSSSFDEPTFFSDPRSVSPSLLSNRRQRQSLTEATVSAEELSVLENDNDIMDIGVYSSNDVMLEDKLSRPRSTGHADPFCVRLPTSFQDPFAEPPQPLLVDRSHQFRRNSALLAAQSVQKLDNQLKENFGRDFKPPLLSTGTTIAGVCGYDAKTGDPFVVLGADTRATAGRIVADKRCQKVHPLARNIWACGAGTSADLDQVTRLCRYSLAMRSLVEHEAIGNAPRRWDPVEESDNDPQLERPARHYASMGAACRFFRDKLYEGGGGIGANLIVGGIDEDTCIPHIRAIHPHGSMDRLPYAALGSGGLAAMATIESRFQSNITLEEGTQIVKEAILAGIQNDLGSGSQVDLCIISVNPSTGRVVSTYTRAALAEEELPGTSLGHGLRGSTDAASEKVSDESLSTPGVNGFGNYPFSLRSKRLIVPSRETEAQERAQEWDKLLGIRHDDETVISFLEK